MRVASDFQFSSPFTKPQVSFIVMHDSQCTPLGKPLGGMFCSGVP